MQNLIILATQRPGPFNLRPTVPALLDIYARDADESQRIMAVAALSAIGDRYGIEELDRLSALERRSSREYRAGRDAVVYYYLTQRMNHETERAAYHLAKGHTKRAGRHARRAALYRSQLGLG